MSEPQSPPLLSVVEPPPGLEPALPRRVGRRALPWLLALAVLGFAWLWLDQLGRTQRFERRVSLLESELAVARDDLVASEARMQDVRNGIEGLTTQLGALRGLAGLSPDASLAPEAVDAGSVDDLVPAD
jgi:hypothetical protein